MNPFSKILFQETSISDLKNVLSSGKYSAVVYGIQSSFEEAIQVNELTREFKIPFYCINSSGLNGFIFSDLADEKFEFSHTKKDSEGNEVQQIESVCGSVSLKQYFANFVAGNLKTQWKKRDVLKPHKLFLLSIIDLHLKQTESLKDIFDLVSQIDGLKQYEGTLRKS